MYLHHSPQGMNVIFSPFIFWCFWCKLKTRHPLTCMQQIGTSIALIILLLGASILMPASVSFIGTWCIWRYPFKTTNYWMLPYFSFQEKTLDLKFCFWFEYHKDFLSSKILTCFYPLFNRIFLMVFASLKFLLILIQCWKEIFSL